MWTSIDTFRADIDWFSSHGDLVNLNTILASEIDSDKPQFSITFDDGWVDNYEHAYPVLRENGIPATIFLVTNAVETGHIFWVEDFLYKIAMLEGSGSQQNIARELTEQMERHGISTDGKLHYNYQIAEFFAESLKPLGSSERRRILDEVYSQLGMDTAPLGNEILDWDQIREMKANGINFGSHTHTHTILQYAEDELIRRELEVSRDILSDRLGVKPDYFCYPNARYRPDNADLIESAGYKYAFKMHNMPLGPETEDYFVPRYLMNEHICSNRNFLLCQLLNIPGFF
jgi:peptidoglycan/xylan/chitin deacetylase (PgdA/CDA1 family)